MADLEYDPAMEPKRGPWRLIAMVAGLGTVGIALAFLWISYERSNSPYSTPASANSPPATIEAADKPVTLKDFQAFQQQIAGTMQSTTQLLTAQQAEIKRISDEVSGLFAKLDLLQRPVAAPAPAVAPAARKKPAAEKPAGAISTGGAPLSAPVQLGR